MNENKNLKKGLGIHARRFIAYIVLILDLRKEYHDFMDHVFCATDYFVITVRCMVF